MAASYLLFESQLYSEVHFYEISGETLVDTEHCLHIAESAVLDPRPSAKAASVYFLQLP
jgi:hypothetical protein